MGWVTASTAILMIKISITSSQACRTTEVDRAGENRAILDAPCVFPFAYKFVNYTSCTDKNDPNGFKWCSTKVDSRGRHIKGTFGYCSPGCPGVEEEGEEDEEEDAEVNQAEEADVSVRSSSIYGRACFSSKGYSGICRSTKYCVGTDYSYSRKCGWDYICCKKAPNRNSALKFASSRQQTSRPASTSNPVWNSKPRVELPATLCGIQGAQPFIFGGKEALPGQFPFMVSFVYTDGRKLENFCGGVLITHIHVLTAGHCFYTINSNDWESGLIDVRVGLQNIQARERVGDRANIASVTLHPQYREVSQGRAGVRNDIAIVTLSGAVDSPAVCLPELARNPNSEAVVLGFGKVTRGKGAGGQQDKLRFAYLEEVSRGECQRRYDDFYRSSRYKPTITEGMVCAGNTEADACSGDSGSPLLYLNTALRWMVAGVVSFGPSSCGNKAPGVYANVEQYIDWIKRETGL